MEGKLNFLFAVLAAVLIAAVAMMTYSCSTPSTPKYFNKKLSLEDAVAAADQNDRPVFALFTADWCEPCAKLKRGALADSRIIQWITENAQPAYLDMTRADSGDADAAAVATRYGVEALPTLMLIRKGREVARFEGVVSARELLKWLTESTRTASTPAG